MKLNELSRFLETIAPLSYQEDYDNSGLIIGNPLQEINSALISLDCTEEVLDEAIKRGCNLIISHHPIVFKGIKKFRGETYIDRVVTKAIKNDIAIYAIHTNLDHVKNGVNAKICQKLGLIDLKILAPKSGMLKKLITYVPVTYAEAVQSALFKAGAGSLGNYTNCSFNSVGYGTFEANSQANPYIGKSGILHKEEEVKIEVVYESFQEYSLISALTATHPYEEVAYDCYALLNTHKQVGAGMLAHLPEEMDEISFLNWVKNKLNTKVIRYTALKGKKVKNIAVCGGSGSFLLKKAIAANADVFITADFKYHEFFDAENQIIIADVGHYESEQFTQELLYELIQKNFPNFALRLTQNNTNPINYLI